MYAKGHHQGQCGGNKSAEQEIEEKVQPDPCFEAPSWARARARKEDRREPQKTRIQRHDDIADNSNGTDYVERFGKPFQSIANTRAESILLNRIEAGEEQRTV